MKWIDIQIIALELKLKFELTKSEAIESKIVNIPNTNLIKMSKLTKVKKKGSSTNKERTIRRKAINSKKLLILRNIPSNNSKIARIKKDISVKLKRRANSCKKYQHIHC